MSNRALKIFMLILFIIFLALYLSQATGYHEYEQYRRVRITEEKIKQFEQDVKEGKPIDVDKYVEDIERDYSNKASQAGFKTSNFIENLFNNMLDVLLNIIEGLFSK
jgi:hypothetical protein